MTTTEPLPTIQKYRRGTIALESATLRLALYNEQIAYNIDRVNHEHVADVLDGVTAEELQDATYARQDVLNATVTVDGSAEEVEVDADDVTFPDLDGGETIQGWVLYEQVGGDDSTPADDPIIAIEDEVRNANDNPVTTNGSDVTVEFSPNGIIRVS